RQRCRRPPRPSPSSSPSFRGLPAALPVRSCTILPAPCPGKTCHFGVSFPWRTPWWWGGRGDRRCPGRRPPPPRAPPGRGPTDPSAFFAGRGAKAVLRVSTGGGSVGGGSAIVGSMGGSDRGGSTGGG